MKLTGRKSMAKLSKLFGQAIARLDGIDESQITPAYIEQQRELKIYPSQTFEDEPWLRSLNRDQMKRITETADELMSFV